MTRSRLSLVSVAALLLLGCKPDSPEIVQREGEPDYFLNHDSAAMDAAMVQARNTYRDFVTALENRSPTMTGFSIKMPFAKPDGGSEHIWLDDVSFDGEQFRGIVNNEPVDTRLVKLGDPASVRPEEISDWMYIDGGVLKGGYTIRVLAKEYTPQQRQEFEERLGFKLD